MQISRNEKGQFIKERTAWNRIAPDLSCLVCFKKFHIPPSRIRAGKGKYCSIKCYAIAIKGRMPPSQKGRVWTDEQKAKLASRIPYWRGKKNPGFHNASTFKKGHTRTPQGPRYHLRGENSGNWKGGKTEESKKIRNSLEYRLWRNSVFIRDNYTCQECLRHGGDLQADHIKPFALYPELRLDASNGRTLCVPCHRKTDTYGWRAKVWA